MNWHCPRCSNAIDPHRGQCDSCGYVLDAIPFERRSRSLRLARRALRREASRLKRYGYELRPASVEWVMTSDEVGTDEALAAGCLFGWLGGRLYLRYSRMGGTLRADFRRSQ